jgi:hypothetical protein
MMKRHATFRPAAVLPALLLFFLIGGNASAQTSRGTVTGIVTDPQAAVVEGATVDLVNLATNQKRTTTTNDSGIYRFDAVDLGLYDVKITSAGFRTLTNTNIQVLANRVTTLDAQLEIGSEPVVVDVTATSGELLQTSEPVRGGNFTTLQVLNLPSGGLNPYNLARLLPGVATATGSGAEFGNASQFSINGQRPRGNNYLIDGTENNDISVTGPANQINNEDAVQEVSVQTGLFSAEFGRAGGGVFNIITKSGTNDYHGTVRWLILSQVFDAVTNGNRNSGLTEPPVYTENIVGGSFGGPLPLPRFGEGGPTVRSGRDRTFFFFGLQFDRFRSTTNFGPFTVPTELGVQQLRALFPAGTNPRVDLYLNAIGNARGLTNLNTIALGTGPNGAGAMVNRGSIQIGRTGVSAAQIADDRQYVLRVDHRVNDSHQLAFRYTDDDNINPATAMNSPGFTRDFAGKSRNFLATHTWIINPTLTNELRVSPYGLIDFNFPISPGAPQLAFTLPNISISGLSALGIATNIPQFRKAKNYLVQDTMTKVFNSHTFRFGVEFLKQTAQQRPPFNERGSFSFTNQAGGFAALANFIDNFSGPTGNANINFGQPVYDPSLLRQSYYFQDSWKTTPNLTLTLGLRYENFGQPANNAFEFPAFAGFDPSQFLVPNRVQRDNNNFGPIVGFAYTPRFKSGPFGWMFGEGSSVIRGGYQVSYDTFFNNMLSNIAADSPNNTSTTTTAPSSGRGLAGFFPGALPSTPRAPTALDQQTSVFNPNIRNPYTQRWSLGIQRELPSAFFLDLSYVGSAGRKLFVTEDLNPIVAQPSTRRFPGLGIRRYRTSGANSDYHSMQVRLDKRLTRGLQFTASYTYSKLIDQISEIFATDASNTSLASVPAFLGGLKLDRAVSDYHRQNRFVFSYVWEIPGPRQGALSHLLGGWQVAGITSFQDGAPLTLINGLDRDGDGNAGGDRPEVGNPSAPRNTRAQIVATTTCTTGLRNPDSGVCVTRNDVYAVQVAANSGFPGPATFGRNTERTNPVENFDMSFFKTFRFTENLKLEYRLEAFNIFNHPQFTGAPGHNITSTLPGNYFNYDLNSGGGRSMRMGLKIMF